MVDIIKTICFIFKKYIEMANSSAQTGALLINAPVTPNTLFSGADFGAFCRGCAGATGDFVNAGVTIPLGVDLALIDAVAYNDNNGDAATVLLSKQYFINENTPTALIDELVAELKNIFAKYVLYGGGLSYAIGGGNLVISGTFQAPFAPVSLYVDNAAIAFS